MRKYQNLFSVNLVVAVVAAGLMLFAGGLAVLYRFARDPGQLTPRTRMFTR